MDFDVFLFLGTQGFGLPSWRLSQCLGSQKGYQRL